MRNSTLTAGALTLVVCGLYSGSTNAAICDSLSLGDGAQDVIIGEAGYRQYLGGPNPGYYFQPYLDGPRLGVCWRNAGGDWNMEVLDCTDDNTSSDHFRIYPEAGDDRVAVLQDAHTYGDLTLLPAGAGYGAMYCGDAGDAIAAWHPAFDFGIYTFLGTGEDLFHGSPNNDIVYSGDPLYSGGVWSMPADNSNDKVCTWGGNDTLYGDEDDNWSVAEDWLDGGTGTDYCDGDYGIDGSDSHDLMLSCETNQDAYSDVGLGWIQCDDDDDPLHEW